jgi:hypothetical protein
LREASQSHVDEVDSAGYSAVDLAGLRPYKSAIVLQFDDVELGPAVAAIQRFFRGRPSGRETQYVVVGVGWDDTQGSSFDELSDFDQLDVIVYRNDSPAPWSAKDASYIDSRHLLNIALFRRGLVAIHLAEPWKGAIQSWLDNNASPPPLRRVPAAALEYSFLRGEAKGLWLKGTHARRPSRPDGKTLTGFSLQNALNPIEDSSFAMGSGRAGFSSDENPALTGTIGTTPRKSTVWSGRASNFCEYVTFCRGLLNEVEQTLREGDYSGGVFPELAEEVSSLEGVFGAYEVLFEWPEGPPGEALDPDVEEAARLIEATTIEVRGRDRSPHFDAMIVFPDESTPVRAEVDVRALNSGFGLDCTIYRERRLRSTGILRECFGNPDRASVYYESGHTITNGRLYKFEVKPARFQNWEFKDFSDYETFREKPSLEGVSMYEAIGTVGERSLFSWVVANFQEGFLTCDDGPGETADFIQVASDLNRLALIHVKAAHSISASRNISAQAYEVVASQAAKNLVFLNHSTLRDRLGRIMARRRPSWTAGVRQPDRSEFLSALAGLRATADAVVYIVQPHMQKGALARARGLEPSSPESLRLRLLETLLNNLRSSAVSYSSDVVVIGDKSQSCDEV